MDGSGMDMSAVTGAVEGVGGVGSGSVEAIDGTRCVMDCRSIWTGNRTGGGGCDIASYGSSVKVLFASEDPGSDSILARTVSS